MTGKALYFLQTKEGSFAYVKINRNVYWECWIRKTGFKAEVSMHQCGDDKNSFSTSIITRNNSIIIYYILV